MKHKIMKTIGALSLLLAATLAWAGEESESPKGIRKETPAVEKAKRTYLGIMVIKLDDTLRGHLKLPKGTGLLVGDVLPKSPAAEAGLKKDDVLQKLEDQVLVNAEQLITLIGSHKKGDAIQLDIIREGKPNQIMVTLGETDAEEIQPAPWLSGVAGPMQDVLQLHMNPSWPKLEVKPLPKPRITYLGIGVEALLPAIAAQLNLDPGVGVMVNLVEPQSPAAVAGIKKYDVILQLADKKLKSPQDVVNQIRALKKEDEVTLQLIRGGKKMEVKAILDEKEDKPQLHFPQIWMQGQGDHLQPFQSYFWTNFPALKPAPNPFKHDLKGYLNDVLKHVPEVDVIISHSGQGLKENPPAKKVEVKNVTINKSQSNQSTMQIASDTGTITVTTSGANRNLIANDPQGKVIFSGPINTEEEKSKVPPSIMEQLRNIKELPDAPQSPNIKKSIRILAPESPNRVI